MSQMKEYLVTLRIKSEQNPYDWDWNDVIGADETIGEEVSVVDCISSDDCN